MANVKTTMHASSNRRKCTKNLTVIWSNDSEKLGSCFGKGIGCDGRKREYHNDALTGDKIAMEDTPSTSTEDPILLQILTTLKGKQRCLSTTPEAT
jgi:hypothetical protein